MKLLFVIADITTKGGTEMATITNANKFCEEGHNVTVISLFKANDRPTLLKRTINTVFILDKKYSIELGAYKRFSTLLHAIIKLKKSNIDWTSYDIIIGEAFLPNFVLWLLGQSGKVIACEHFKYDLYSPFLTNIRNCIYRKFRTVVSLTQSATDKFIANGVTAVTIPNMVPLLPSYEHSQNKRIITVGRLSHEKGFDLLIQTLPRVKELYPDWKIYHYGEGPLLNKLKTLAKSLGVSDYIYFKGYSSNIRKELINSSILVMPSRHEGFPLVLLEAMICNIPVIAYACSKGPIELLSDNCGYLVAPESINGMTDAICQTINNENGRIEMANNAFKKVMLYTPDRIYSKWMELFRTFNK